MSTAGCVFGLDVRAVVQEKGMYQVHTCTYLLDGSSRMQWEPSSMGIVVSATVLDSSAHSVDKETWTSGYHHQKD